MRMLNACEMNLLIPRNYNLAKRKFYIAIVLYIEKNQIRSAQINYWVQILN